MVPNTIIKIARTNNQQELAELYSNAFVFVNLTYQDNYPTTNMEALACGCPDITYNTGGSPESLPDGRFTVSKGNYRQVFKIIKDEIGFINRNDVAIFAHVHDKNKRFLEYISLYKSLFDKNI